MRKIRGKILRPYFPAKDRLCSSKPGEGGFFGSPHEFWYSSANPRSPLVVYFIMVFVQA